MRWSIAVLLSAVLLCSFPARADEPTPEEYFELMRLFIDSYEQIDRNYVKPVERRELIEAALQGMLEKLDPYSNYISPDDLAKFNQQVEQEFGGIGIQVNFDPQSRRLAVMTPLPGTPAYRAGIRAGDLIMEIDGKSTEGFQLDDALAAMRGKAGESVTIGILHRGSDKVETITVTREIVHISSVLGDSYTPEGKMNFFVNPEKKIAYVRLTSFGRDSTQELLETLNQLEKDGMSGLILDLRFNPGGLLQAATEISDLFIEEGKIVSTKGRNIEERVFSARKPGTFTVAPMVVLINRYSASASEIVSACLQDHKRALIIGERSFGKGSVQNVVELEGGKSALRLTTASYHRPSGRNIHRFPNATDADEWGVMPDDGYKIDFSLDELQGYLEYRRNRDVISQDGPPKSEYIDRQLAKAVEHIETELAKKENPAPEQKPEEKPKTETPEKPKESSPTARIRLPIRIDPRT